MTVAAPAYAQVPPAGGAQTTSEMGMTGAPSANDTPAEDPAAEAPTPGSQRARALEYYERGRTFYASGRYRASVEALERAYRLDPSGTNLLFNLGAVLERMGQIDRAIDAYERYMSRLRDPEERRRTERIVVRLRGARVELAEMSRRRGRADELFWSVAGASLASTAVGVTWFATLRAGSSSTAPIIFTVGGLSLGVLAAVLYFARDAPPRRTLYVTAGPAPGGATLGVVGAF